MSLRLGIELFHFLDELVEEVLAVVGPGGRLGVVLDREGGELAVAHALQGVVVQVDVGDLHLLLGQAVEVDDEAVVLGGDLDRPGRQVFHGVVGAVVAELELRRAPPRAKPRIWCPRQMPKMGFFPSRARTAETA